MTLLELSAQYRQSADAINRRIRILRQQQHQATDSSEISRLQRRICDLQPLLRQCSQLAELTEHYYDRGYKRNGFYTI